MLIKIAGNYSHFLLFLWLCSLNSEMTLDLAEGESVQGVHWLLKV